jgi:hypothetical protein
MVRWCATSNDRGGTDRSRGGAQVTVGETEEATRDQPSALAERTIGEDGSLT